jgi:hypothetical protein
MLKAAENMIKEINYVVRRKRCKLDKNRFFKLDIPCLDGELMCQIDSFHLNCEQLAIKMVEVNEHLGTTKEFAVKLLTYELNRSTHKFLLFLETSRRRKMVKFVKIV